MSACAPVTGSAGDSPAGTRSAGRSQKSFCGSMIRRWNRCFAMIGLLITGAYILKAIGSVLHGPLNEAWAGHAMEINRREVLAIVPLMILILTIGVWPAWILRVIEPTVTRLFG